MENCNFYIVVLIPHLTLTRQENPFLEPRSLAENEDHCRSFIKVTPLGSAAQVLFLFSFSIFHLKQGYFPNRRLGMCCNNTLRLVYEVLGQEFVTQQRASRGAAAAAAAQRTTFDCLHQCHLVVTLHPPSPPHPAPLPL